MQIMRRIANIWELFCCRRHHLMAVQGEQLLLPPIILVAIHYLPQWTWLDDIFLLADLVIDDNGSDCEKKTIYGTEKRWNKATFPDVSV